MNVIYEIFEFKDGHSLREKGGPIGFISVPEGARKYDVVKERGFLGNPHGYGYAEVTDVRATGNALVNESNRLIGLAKDLSLQEALRNA